MSRSILVALLVYYGWLAGELLLPPASAQRCEFDIAPESAERVVRCYALNSIGKLRKFIDDDRPVKVQVINAANGRFHLNDDGAGNYASGDDVGTGIAATAAATSDNFIAQIEELDLSRAGHLVTDGGHNGDPGKILRQMRSLRMLILSNSNLSTLNADWFNRDANQITFLDASGNHLQEVTFEKHLASLNALQRLDLSHNSIHTVALEGMHNLMEVNLNQNQLSDLTFLGPLNRLKILRAENNDLKTIRRLDFGHDSQLETLDVAINFIGGVEPRSFDDLSHLQTLNISHNTIKNLSFFSILTQLQNLTTLDVSFNALQEIAPLQLFKLNSLRHLNLSDNFLLELGDKALTGLFSLKHLQLNDNRLKRLHRNAFSQLFDLEYLDLSSNQLQELDTNLFTIPGRRLKRLFLRDNKLQSIDENLFSNSRSLVQLDLSGNTIKSLMPHTFRPLVNLRIVHLDRNKLESFSMRQIKESQQLRVIFLNDNRLTHVTDLGADMLADLIRLVIFTIDQNPWQCACMDEMMALFRSRKINYTYEKDYFANNGGGAQQSVVCVVTDDCYTQLSRKHENQIRELFYAEF